MYNFIKIQYTLGRLTSAQVATFAPKWITEEQVIEIIGKGRID